MMYFDNAATTYPKPPQVARAVSSAVTRFGGNPGRSGHAMSLRAAQMVYECREKTAELEADRYHRRYLCGSTSGGVYRIFPLFSEPFLFPQ